MKARIEVIIRDEQGKVMGQMTPKTLELGHQRLDEIEGAVEEWRREVLPDLEAEFAAQRQFTEEKKTALEAKRSPSGEGVSDDNYFLAKRQLEQMLKPLLQAPIASTYN